MAEGRSFLTPERRPFFVPPSRPTHGIVTRLLRHTSDKSEDRRRRCRYRPMAEFLKFAEKVKEQRKVTAEKLLTDRVMTREELIKIGLLSDKYVN